MESKIVLINGGIGCGKTEAVKYLQKIHGGVLTERRCKDKLHELTMAFFCVEPELYWEIYEDRVMKEAPNDAFCVAYPAYQQLVDMGICNDVQRHGGYFTLSIREAMIYVSECICKPTFGVDYFGEARAAAIQEGEYAIDDSAGFEEELQPTIDKLGVENILLIRVRGRGSFEGDSRSFLSGENLPYVVDLYNTGSLKGFLDDMAYTVNAFYSATTKGF